MASFSLQVTPQPEIEEASEAETELGSPPQVSLELGHCLKGEEAGSALRGAEAVLQFQIAEQKGRGCRPAPHRPLEPTPDLHR